MTESEHTRFVTHHARGELLSPERPGRAIAIMALYTPSAWSGEFIRWDDERVAALVPE